MNREARLSWIRSSCRCYSPELEAAGRVIGVGDEIPSGRELQLGLIYEPDAPAGQTEAVMRLGFALAGSAKAKLQREVRIRCEIDPELSLVSSKDIQVELQLPADPKTILVQLRRAVPVDAIDVGGASWIRVEGQDEDDAGSVLRLRIGPIREAGEHRTVLKLPLSKDRWQRVPLLVSAKTDEGFSPDRLVLNIATGAYLEQPVRLAGGKIRLAGEWLEWEQEPGAGPEEDSEKPGAAGHQGELGLDLLPGTEEQDAVPATSTDAGLRFTVRASAKPGLYKGRALVEPRPDAGYRIGLPYVIRVYSLRADLDRTSRDNR
ncbi:MAG: hypothetical protein ACE5F1_12500 [Planctomycetota bacterium]